MQLNDIRSVQWDEVTEAIERCYELGWTDGLPVVEHLIDLGGSVGTGQATNHWYQGWVSSATTGQHHRDHGEAQVERFGHISDMNTMPVEDESRYRKKGHSVTPLPIAPAAPGRVVGQTEKRPFVT